MEWPFSQDLSSLGTLPALLLVGLGLIIVFGGIGILRRAVANVFNIAYSVAMVGAVYLSVAVLSAEVPAPENWLTFLLLTSCVGLLVNFEPVGAVFLGTVRWALLLITIPVLTYFILFELIITDAQGIALEVRLILSVSSLVGLALLAIAARYFSRLIGREAQPAPADPYATREPDQTVLLANQARTPQPALLPALIVIENALVFPAPGANPIRQLSQGRQVVVIARDPTGEWFKLQHREDLWMHGSSLQIQGNPLYLRVIQPQ